MWSDRYGVNAADRAAADLKYNLAEAYVYCNRSTLTTEYPVIDHQIRMNRLKLKQRTGLIVSHNHRPTN